MGEVFARFWHSGGASRLGPPLAREPAVVALLALLRLDADDWPLAALLAVLGSNYFRPDWPEWRGGGALAAVDREIRRWQIPQGRRPLLDELQTDGRGDCRQFSCQRNMRTDPRLACATDNELPRIAAAVLGRLAAAWTNCPSGQPWPPGARPGNDWPGTSACWQTIAERRGRLGLPRRACAKAAPCWPNGSGSDAAGVGSPRRAGGACRMSSRPAAAASAGRRRRAACGCSRPPASAVCGCHICSWPGCARRHFPRRRAKTASTARPITSG